MATYCIKPNWKIKMMSALLMAKSISSYQSIIYYREKQCVYTFKLANICATNNIHCEIDVFEDRRDLRQQRSQHS